MLLVHGMFLLHLPCGFCAELDMLCMISVLEMITESPPRHRWSGVHFTLSEVLTPQRLVETTVGFKNPVRVLVYVVKMNYSRYVVNHHLG